MWKVMNASATKYLPPHAPSICPTNAARLKVESLLMWWRVKGSYSFGIRPVWLLSQLMARPRPSDCNKRSESQKEEEVFNELERC